MQLFHNETEMATKIIKLNDMIILVGVYITTETFVNAAIDFIFILVNQ